MDELSPWLKEGVISSASIHTAPFLYTSNESKEVEIIETHRALAQLGFESQRSSLRLFQERQKFGTPHTKEFFQLLVSKRTAYSIYHTMSVDFRYSSSTEAHIQNISYVKNVKNLVFLGKN